MTRRRAIRFSLAAALGLAVAEPQPARAAGYPAWWTNRQVVVSTSATNDYFAANLGQLKWFATNACDELEANLPGGAGATVWALVRGFGRGGNRVAVNLGQLKTVAAPFYARIIAERYATAYPWTETTADDANHAPVNLGQLKRVFAFDLTMDTDSDGLPDMWETANGLNRLDDADGIGDDDQDGLSNAAEYAARTNPQNPDTDADGLPDGEESTWGANLLLADTDGDGLGDGWEVAWGCMPTNPFDNEDCDHDGMPDQWEGGCQLDPYDPSDAALDPDGDGLRNVEEAWAGTDPHESDSDQDGIPDVTAAWSGRCTLALTASPDEDDDGMCDRWEAAQGFSPSSAADATQDADQDGLQNRQEFVAGTDAWADTGDDDWDGLSNDAEAYYGTDPNASTTWVLDHDDETPHDWTELDDTTVVVLNLNSWPQQRQDFDCDGLSNAAEVRFGTDLLRRDTDGDGKTDGEEANGELPSDPADPLDEGDGSNCLPLYLWVGAYSAYTDQRYVLRVERADNGPSVQHQSAATLYGLEERRYALRKGCTYQVAVAMVYPEQSGDFNYNATISEISGCHWKQPTDYLGLPSCLLTYSHDLLGEQYGTGADPEVRGKETLIVPHLELHAQAGYVHHGFDPPNRKAPESDPATEPYWASVVQGGKNEIVKVQLSHDELVGHVTCSRVGANANAIAVQPATCNARTTPLMIEAPAGQGPDILDATVEFVWWRGQEAKVLATLKVMVLPAWTVPVGIYTLRDLDSGHTTVQNAPNGDDCITVCNDVFKQAGVSFNLAAFENKTWPYDTRGIVELGSDVSWYSTGAYPREGDGVMSRSETYAFIRGDPPQHPPAGSTAFGSPLPPLSIAIVNAGAVPYANDGPPYVRGASGGNGIPGIVFARNLVTAEHLKLAVAHEFGHVLGLSTAEEDGGHDVPPYAEAVENDVPLGQAGTKPGPAYDGGSCGTEHVEQPERAIMASGSPANDRRLPWLHGRWMRQEDWKKANLAARGLQQ